MWNTESSKHFIKKITKEYGREIIQEGSVSVLGLADHLDEIVAKAINIYKNFVTLARQWHIVLERATFTEGIDKVKEVLEREEVVVITQQEKINDVAKEVEMGIEEVIVTETNRAKEVESYEITRQNIQHQEKADSTAKGIERFRAPEIMEDIQLVENSIEIYPHKIKIEERLEKNEKKKRMKSTS